MAYKIYIDGFIGDAGIFGGDCYTLKNLRQDLAAKPEGDNEIDVYINSGGGYVTEGFAIHDELVKQSATVNTIVTGLCGSIATVIAQAGKKGSRKIYQNSEYFIHNPSWSPQSPDPMEADELLTLAQDLKSNEQKLVNFYAFITGKDAETFRVKMNEAKTLSAEEAKELGLIDEVITTNIQAATIYKFAAHVSKTKTPMATIEEKLKGMFDGFKAELKAIVKPQIKNEMKETSEGVTIWYDGDLGVGTKIWADESMTTPAPDGVHTVDGVKYTVANGEVTEVGEVEDIEALKAKIADLEAQVASKETEVTAKVEEAITANTNELTAAFDNKFKAFQAKFFTGDKLNDDIVQMFKPDGTQTPSQPKTTLEIAMEYRKNKLK